MTHNDTSLQHEQWSHSECIPWTGPVSRGGYGIARIGDTTTTASRRAWIRAHGPIPDGLEIDHLCRNPPCVNLDHLELVTHRENMHRQPTYPVSVCANGHPLDGDNVYHYTYADGRLLRSCKACRRENSRRWEAKRK